MKNFIAIVLAFFVVFFQGCVMAENLVDDIKSVRESNKSANVDVSENVRKYIAIGVSREWVENYLRGLGFKLYPQPRGADNTQTLVAVRSEQQIIPTGFNDEIRVIVVFFDEVVKTSNGKLIFRSL